MFFSRGDDSKLGTNLDLNHSFEHGTKLGGESLAKIQRGESASIKRFFFPLHQKNQKKFSHRQLTLIACVRSELRSKLLLNWHLFIFCQYVIHGVGTCAVVLHRTHITSNMCVYILILSIRLYTLHQTVYTHRCSIYFSSVISVFIVMFLSSSFDSAVLIRLFCISVARKLNSVTDRLCVVLPLMLSLPFAAVNKAKRVATETRRSMIKYAAPAHMRERESVRQGIPQHSLLRIVRARNTHAFSIYVIPTSVNKTHETS